MIATCPIRLALRAGLPIVVFLVVGVVCAIFTQGDACGQDVVRSGYVASDVAQGTTLPPLRPIEGAAVDPAVVERTTPPVSTRRDASVALRTESPQTAPATPPRQYESIPLRQPDQKVDGDAKGFEFKAPDGVVRNTAISLGLVLGLFLVVAWMMKKSQPRSHSALPSGVVEVLGRVQVSPKQQLQLIRMGPKLLLVSSTGQQMQTLGEISEPHQVEQMLALCHSDRSGGVSQSFRQIMGQFEKETVHGFLGDADRNQDGTSEARNANSSPGRRRRAWT